MTIDIQLLALKLQRLISADEELRHTLQGIADKRGIVLPSKRLPEASSIGAGTGGTKK